MIAHRPLAVTVAALAGLAVLASGGWAASVLAAGLSPVVRPADGARWRALPDGRATIDLAPGTPLFAPVAGVVGVTAGSTPRAEPAGPTEMRGSHDVAIDGADVDSGVQVTLDGVTPLLAAGSAVHRGDVVASAGGSARPDDLGTGGDGAVPAGDHAGGGGSPGAAGGEAGRPGSAPSATVTVTVSLHVDGHVVDAAPLLAAADGSPPGAVPDAGWLPGDPSGTAVGAASSAALARPLLGAQVTQEFGCTDLAIEPVDLACPGGHFHSGIDLAAPSGTPVQAALGGRATVLLSPFGYGLHVVLDHGDGRSTLYAHLETVLVSDGDDVPTGGVIGTVGSSGNSTGPHLHFEIRSDGIPENPRRFLALP